MLIVRLLLTIGGAFLVGALALYFITGNRDYLQYLSRSVFFVLLILVILGVGTVVGRLLGFVL